MSSIVMRQTEATIHTLETFKRNGKFARHFVDVGEKVDYDRVGAINAEEVEHNMTVIEAVKAYPAARWWAFVMSCTIVSSCP